MSDSTFKVVETLGEGHVQQLVALYQNEWWTRGRTVDEVRRMLAGSDHVFAMCTSSGERLVAFARVLTDGVFKALLLDIIVASEFRSEGLGRKLMDTMVNHPILGNVRHLELYCLPEMVGFYEKWGFSTEVSGIQFMRRNSTS
ncbi:MAG: GNAT family N-acetyltransferase [Candidatus Eisenbacteria bacterium]|uniref:GNAT family N-acetyltransferase n=1 Tax=Eiseniibacteriota bacterium TaxID=2212470 RepID=A0A7Y2E588_UNCEI|nr:GNAT family N-acetyltransferase [Candidatus Eisenbacteria bacterium]